MNVKRRGSEAHGDDALHLHQDADGGEPITSIQLKSVAASGQGASGCEVNRTVHTPAVTVGLSRESLH